MKFGKGLLLAGLLGCVGCMNNSGEKLPDAPPPKRTAKAEARPDLGDDEVPAAVSKLLAPEQLNARNANAQAKAMADQLMREKGQLGRTESARNDE